jgi:hypothetical protein
MAVQEPVPLGDLTAVGRTDEEDALEPRLSDLLEFLLDRPFAPVTAELGHSHQA